MMVYPFPPGHLMLYICGSLILESVAWIDYVTWALSVMTADKKTSEIGRLDDTPRF